MPWTSPAPLTARSQPCGLMSHRPDIGAISWRTSCAAGAAGSPRCSDSARADWASASTSWIWAEPVSVDALLISVSPVVVYVLVALVIGLESMGIPLPGEVILVSAALLATRQDLDISPVWIAAAASGGAIVGDSIGYLAGRRWGAQMFDGPVAGALNMPYPRFLAANALGGFVWACGTTAAVYTMGTRAEQWLHDSSWIGLAVAVGAGIAVSTVFRRRLERSVARHTDERKSRDDQLSAVVS